VWWPDGDHFGGPLDCHVLGEHSLDYIDSGSDGWNKNTTKFETVCHLPQLEQLSSTVREFRIFFFVGEFGVSRLLLETEWAKRGWDVL